MEEIAGVDVIGRKLGGTTVRGDARGVACVGEGYFCAFLFLKTGHFSTIYPDDNLCRTIVSGFQILSNHVYSTILNRPSHA